ncbi:heme lyase CcmF/NrfE family subunit [Limnobacter humi]|uniref:Heme lyase CcmF/NrfE family subunit n=1 Tax=Limnobacter humi TaxID=1778671 RepID=A0ABT1WFH0_9BURK|nr:heme lyase CcmF/NrfE family subunit [Limnobacter humi]MCQ8896269.1 heme lyase CcmF/NrfE family subunit [Limnobacter humi]
MIATLAQWALSLALLLCVSGACSGLAALRGVRGHAVAQPVLLGTQRHVAGIFSLVVVAFAGLLASFMLSDFSVRNVAENSNLSLPLFYKVAASWGSHEGSFLLWILMFTGWMQAVSWSRFDVSASFKARVLCILQLVLSGFLLYLLLASNPFEHLSPAPLDGRDLNPLLQDVIMVIHPPMLYMGYVGFAVSFAFAMAGLLEGRFDMSWARWSRPWANTAWAFLTVGIALGSWWAYRELGWGGWWFWDPVENASLMPWLAGTALIHSLAVSEKRGALKSWTVLLALTTFALSLLGTFLVRSGVLTSVHAFATDPKRGIFILVILLLVVGGSYLLYALRAGQVGQGGTFKASGREALLLSNNVLMSAALVTVMLGTLYPLVVEVLNGRKMSVGQPYFEALFVPLLLPAVLLMALGPDSRWRETPLARYVKPGALAMVLSLVALGLAWLNSGHFSALWALGVVSAAFLALSTLAHAQRAQHQLQQQRPETGWLYRAQRLSPSYWAMVLAHLGVAVFVLGVSSVKTFELEKDLVMKPGQTEEIGPWRLTFIGVDSVQRVNHVAALGVFELTRGAGNVIYLMEPEKRRYQSSSNVMTEAAIHTDWFSDVYISLGEAVQGGNNAGATQSWGVRVYYKPLINLIWWGCALMALGGFITVMDRRYRGKGQGI